MIDKILYLALIGLAILITIRQDRLLTLKEKLLVVEEKSLIVEVKSLVLKREIMERIRSDKCDIRYNK